MVYTYYGLYLLWFIVIPTMVDTLLWFIATMVYSYTYYGLYIPYYGFSENNGDLEE